MKEYTLSRLYKNVRSIFYDPKKRALTDDIITTSIFFVEFFKIFNQTVVANDDTILT